MKYFQSCVIPVKTEGKAAYLEIAKKAASVFAEHGALRTVECWGDNVMDGKITDFKRAVQASADETIVFSWIWWADKATADAAASRIMGDDRMKSTVARPYDGRKMIYGGFELHFDTGGVGRLGYVDAVVASLPDEKRHQLPEHAARMAGLFQEQGATRLVDGWGADVPAGEATDFRRAVQAKDGETVVCGWIEWPDKSTRDAGRSTLMHDPRMRDTPPVWDGRLAIFGGFVPILDTARA